MDPHRTALVLVGVQNDYFRADGALRPYIQHDPSRALAHTMELLDDLRDSPVLVVSTPIRFSPDYGELIEPVGMLASIKEAGALRAGSDGSAPVDELRRFGDRVLEVWSERGLNAFTNPALHALLASSGIDDVVIAGAFSSVFIDSTARSARACGYRVSVLSDCTTARTATAHRYCCEEIFPLYADVIDRHAFLRALDRGGGQPAERVSAPYVDPLDDLAVQAQYRLIEALVEQETALAAAQLGASEARAAAEGLRRAAVHDPLTGLANRRRLHDELDRILARARRHGWTTAVLALDLDGFRRINHDLGDDVGDAVLVEVARRLEATMRDYDALARPYALARIGGDEFFVVCEGVETDAAVSAIVTRIHDAVALPMELPGGPISLTASVGAVLRRDADDPGAVIRDAELAMRGASARGPGCSQTFSEGLRPARGEVTEAEAALRSALEHGELRLAYQPKVDLGTGRIAGVEALLRWEHPARGTVPPVEFIALAEDTGLIVPIGAWVLDEACRQAARWSMTFSDRPPLQVSVNVSGRQLGADLFATVAGAVEAAGVDARLLGLEVTESAVMADVGGAIALLKRLKTLGLTISIDDFGTGYSSLAYLRRLPLDEIKVDKSFVDGLGHDPEDTAIVAAVVAMAHALGLVVVAEGVETDEQLASLRTLGCEAAQGYLFARPQPPEGIEALLRSEAEQSWAGHEAERPDPAVPATARYRFDRVLVVDDTSDVRQLARMSLTAAGFEVHEAVDGRAGLAMVAELGPDCVLLDVVMPDLDGYAVCRELRSDPATANCTIVMVSSEAAADDKVRAFSAGADDYIVKPFKPRDLVSRVQTAMRRRQDRQP